MPELLRHAWLKDAQEALHGPEAAVDGKALTTFQAETMATATLARVTSKRGAEKARALEEAAKLCEHLISEGPRSAVLAGLAVVPYGVEPLGFEPPQPRPRSQGSCLAWTRCGRA